VFGADGAKTIQVRQADSWGNYSPAGTLAFTLDKTAAAPTIALASDTSGGSNITSNGVVNVFGVELGGTWQYSLNAGQTWKAGSGSTISSATFGADGTKAVLVRQIDVARNTSASSSLSFVLDTSAAAPAISLAQDTSGGQAITSNGQVNIASLESGSSWQYSMNGGQTWSAGTGSSIAASAFGADGAKTVQVRQIDLANNVSPVASLSFVLATVAAVPILELEQDTSAGQGVTSNGKIDLSGLAASGTWQYSLNGGQTWITGTGTFIASSALGADGAKTVGVKQTDAAGNVSGVANLTFTLDTAALAPTVALAQDTSSGKMTTSNGQVNIGGLASGATWQYSLDGGQTWITGTGTSIAASAFGLDGYKSAQVQQTDLARNVSPATSISFTLAHGTPIYDPFGQAIGETIDNGDGTEQRIAFNTTRTGSWAYTDQLWQKATTSSASQTVSSNDWVGVDTGYWVTDESGTHWVDTGMVMQQQVQSHTHSVVTQHDSVERSVTTANTDGTSSTLTVSNSPGEQPWSQLIQTYEGGTLLDTITTNDNGTRSITVNRAAGSDAMAVVNTDTISFASNVFYNQIWFNKSGNDLEVSVIGQNETMTLSNWYASSANHIGSIASGDGYTIADTGVQAMVQAMSSLTVPLSGQTTLPAATASQLSSALASNWRHA